MNVEDTQIGRVCCSCLASHLNKTLQNLVFTVQAISFPTLIKKRPMRHIHISEKSDDEIQICPTRSALFISQPGVRSKWFNPWSCSHPQNNMGQECLTTLPALRPPAGNRGRQPDFLELFTLHLELRNLFTLHELQFFEYIWKWNAAASAE